MSGLFGSTILEVVLGLSFVFILLSLVCSSVNELLAGFLKLRAKDLDTAIRNLLCDRQLADEVLAHPLVKALGSTRSETVAVQVGAGGGAAEPRDPVRRRWRRFTGSRRDFAGKPSYIPARTFSVALFDTITPPTGRAITVGDLQRAAEQLGGLDVDMPDLAKESKPVAELQSKELIGRALLSLINESRDPRQLFLTLESAKAMVAEEADAAFSEGVKGALAAAGTLDELRRRVEALPESGARTRLLAAIAEGQAGLDRARHSIEVWFDDAMERASGVYKRRTQWWLLVIASIVTLLLGADTFRLYDSLAANPGLRTALVAQAEQASQPGGVLVTPTAADLVATPAAGDAAETPPGTSVESIFDALDQTSLPFGYGDLPGLDGDDPSAGDWAVWVIAKVAGLLVTMFAVALGAPFWFDVLNRVANIRAAGKPPTPTSSTPPPANRPS